MDDILCIYHDPDNVLDKLNGYVPLKPCLGGSPDMYLGINLKHMQLHNGIWTWPMSLSKYHQKLLRICVEYVAKHLDKGYRLLKGAENQFAMDYCPEWDVSPVLEPNKASYYLPLIVIMKWMVKIGCTDINIKVSL